MESVTPLTVVGGAAPAAVGGAIVESVAMVDSVAMVVSV